MEKSFFANVKEIDFSKAFDENNFNSDIIKLNAQIEKMSTIVRSFSCLLTSFFLFQNNTIALRISMNLRRF